MVQIGDLHIGSANTAVKPKIAFGEASAVWENLMSRYDLLETLQIIINYVSDDELKNFIKTRIINTMKPQIESLEKILLKHQIPLPPRPPKDVTFKADSGVVNDEYIFRRVFNSIQDFLNVCSEAIKVTVVSDEIRGIFYDYLIEKIELFDDACDFGIKKGWFEVPPMLK